MKNIPGTAQCLPLRSKLFYDFKTLLNNAAPNRRKKQNNRPQISHQTPGSVPADVQ